MREVRADMRGWSAKRKAKRALEMLCRGDRFIEDFGERQYDNCFENGDGDAVIAFIVAECGADLVTAHRVGQSKFACLKVWQALVAAKAVNAGIMPPASVIEALGLYSK
jgi:hypothetical protein